MLVGPVFTREVLTSPRRTRTYVARAAYPGVLLVLMCTAWLLLAGIQVVEDTGEFARFGLMLFQVLGPLQLGLALFCSALLAAGAVAQEKDRGTLVLLLITRLTNAELVLGRLLASLLNILILVAAALPCFMLACLFGGIAWQQVLQSFAVTLVTTFAAGSLGSTLALWREKTFQTLAMTALAIVFWLVAWEVVALGLLGSNWLEVPTATWATAFSPWQAILETTRPATSAADLAAWWSGPVTWYIALALIATAVLNLVAIWRVRVWNPSREIQAVPREAEDRDSIWGLVPVEQSAAPVAAPAKQPLPSREVWDNPILWREIRTRAYGRRMLVVRVAYLLLFTLSAAGCWYLAQTEAGLTRWNVAAVLVPLGFLSLVLINAQAVTSLTTERDGRMLDLLLVTDLTPKEFVFGKLAGVAYNTKEMILLPLVLGIGLWLSPRGLPLENVIYLVGGLLVVELFAITLGFHCGMTYANSRVAIATSIGTVFFLVVGIATCMRLMVAFSGSFSVQLQPFLAFMLGGGVGLYMALGARNPSPAIGLASLLCPFATFYAITSFMLDHTLTVFLVVACMYGFATVAMLVPALYEFDVATGRTTLGEE
ncbi:MAG: ABC transporter permease subunit [Pirellulales bacterium]|nr:ABC transporter permease subunit [Pirellulales bacterium]